MTEAAPVHLRVKEQHGIGAIVSACTAIGLAPPITDSMTDDTENVTCPACALIANGNTGLAAQLHGKRS